jgi:hypothetical protein
MKTKIIQMSLTIEVDDTDNDLYDVMVAIDKARARLAETPAHQILREPEPVYGGPRFFRVTKIKHSSQGGVIRCDPELPPFEVKLDDAAAGQTSV